MDKDSRQARVNARNGILLIRDAQRYRDQTRQYSRKKKSDIRKFTLAELNFKAEHYGEMVKMKRVGIPNHHLPGWSEPPIEFFYVVYTINYKGPKKWALITEPPATMALTDAELSMLVEDPTRLDIFAPCHSQKVEFFVAATSQVAHKYRTEENQLGASFQLVHARETNQGRVTHKKRKLLYEKSVDC